jgi:hypothetical protein
MVEPNWFYLKLWDFYRYLIKQFNFEKDEGGGGMTTSCLHNRNRAPRLMTVSFSAS